MARPPDDGRRRRRGPALGRAQRSPASTRPPCPRARSATKATSQVDDRGSRLFNTLPTKQKPLAGWVRPGDLGAAGAQGSCGSVAGGRLAAHRSGAPGARRGRDGDIRSGARRVARGLVLAEADTAAPRRGPRGPRADADRPGRARPPASPAIGLDTWVQDVVNVLEYEDLRGSPAQSGKSVRSEGGRPSLGCPPRSGPGTVRPRRGSGRSLAVVSAGACRPAAARLVPDQGGEPPRSLRRCHPVTVQISRIVQVTRTWCTVDGPRGTAAPLGREPLFSAECSATSDGRCHRRPTLTGGFPAFAVGPPTRPGSAPPRAAASRCRSGGGRSSRRGGVCPGAPGEAGPARRQRPDTGARRNIGTGVSGTGAG